MKVFILKTISVLLSVFICLMLVELGIKVRMPQEILHPKFGADDKYGIRLPGDKKIRHSKRGKYDLLYSTNSKGFRKNTCIKSGRAKYNIICIGDSYTFGFGVDDAHVYPRLLCEYLGHGYYVYNFGSPGWGLSQEIRAYYEYSEGIDHHAVILQYAENDPRDSFYRPVTGWDKEKKRFVFEKVTSEGEILTKIRRILQLPIVKQAHNALSRNSQLWNFIGNRLHMLRWNHDYYKAIIRKYGRLDKRDIFDMENRYYNSLLRHFSSELRSKGLRVLFIPVKGDLEKNEMVRQCIDDLDDKGMIELMDSSEWFDPKICKGSPEGHKWGRMEHMIVAKKLAGYIENKKEGQ